MENEGFEEGMEELIAVSTRWMANRPIKLLKETTGNGIFGSDDTFEAL